MKLDVNALRYLSREEFRTLQAVELGQKNVRRLFPSCVLCSKISAGFCVLYMVETFILVSVCVVYSAALTAPLVCCYSMRLYQRRSSTVLQGSGADFLLVKEHVQASALLCGCCRLILTRYEPHK